MSLNAVRTYVALFLVWILLACPVLCRATDEGCCADQEMTTETSDEHQTPAPSDDATSCICGGAIKVPNLRVHGHGPGVLLPATDTLASDSLPSPTSLIEQLARSDMSPEFDHWRGSGRFHALLQNFRC
jgi:hypothetical protein